jgi:ATP-dependent exoDNAse (exonuclease V) beta subunit
VLGAAEEEMEAAVRVVARALAHPLLARAAIAARAGGCRRETPVTLRLDDGTLVEGVVDLAFLDAGAWTVVDFKTDHELARGLDGYRRQVALYADAIRAATGQPASGVLLRV